MNEKYWDEIYSDISKIRPWEKPEWVNVCTKKIEQCLYSFSQRKCLVSLLDFGCGSGTYFPLFLKMGMNCITGVDISTTVVKYLKKKYKKNPSIRLIAGGIESCPSNGVKYDIIVFWGVAHHINPKEWDGCLQCFQSHLSDDGVLLVSGWGGGDPRFKQGSPAFSVHSHKQTWSIDGLRPLLESRFTVEEFGNLHFEDEDPLLCSDAFDYYVCKKKMSIESRQLSSLRSYLSTLYDRISFTQFIRYSFEADVKNAQMDRETSITHYRDKEEVKGIFGRLIQQVTEKCGRGTSFTTEIYQRPQKNNIFVEMSAAPQKLVCVGSSEGIRYSFVGDGESSARGSDSQRNETKKYNIQSMSVKELFSLIEKGNVFRYTGCDFDKLERVGIYSRVDAFAEKLFYAFNHGKRLFFYYFNNATLSVSHKELGDGGLMIYASSALSDKELKKIDILFKRWASSLSIESFSKLSTKLATKSAIGSIMSRNGSHNIGSHVLAALSHNVGTMPDDRVLYQYIQQRMDYIATVTTDFPTWAQPTMFVADMIKTFLSQRHLLNYIVESEGLRGFQFQNPNMSDEEWYKQKNCVKIHVRKKALHSAFVELIKYDAKERSASVDLKCDVALAISGGIVGEHAFFTILENIIRNAAKHSWASLKKKEKEEYKNLDIYIDFDEKESIVDFEVYARLPLKDMKHTDISPLKRAEVENWVKRFEGPEGLSHKDQKIFDKMPLHRRQQIMLARPLINSQGLLRRENWGLAEMKISAGYLAGSKIEDIGGVGTNNDSIIHPYIISEGRNKYFGYRFSIEKPKEILIIVKDEKERSKWVGKGNKHCKNGIFVKTVDEVKQSRKLNYRYVVHYDAGELFDREKREPKNGILLPFRMISGRVPRWLSPFVATINFEELRKAFNKSKKTDVEKLVYKSYLSHICEELKVDPEQIGLLVAVNENEKTGGNSLISDADILELMMEQNFAACVDQYGAISHEANLQAVFKLLQSVRYSSNDDSKVQKFKNLPERTIRELIAQRLYDWMSHVENAGELLKEVSTHLQGKYFAFKMNDSAENKRDRSFEKCANAMTKSHAIDNFIRYAESVFENTKKLFKQYEEKIVTLPVGFSPSKRDLESIAAPSSGSDLGIQMAWSVEQVKAEDKKKWIAYRRHDCTLAQVAKAERLYVEPLSGTQTYLSEFAKIKDDLGLQVRLIENGLMRILVLDERVAKFLHEHISEVGAHYKAMNINVVDHEWVDANNHRPVPDGFYGKFNSKLKEALQKYVYTKGKTKLPKLNDVDILIVHQGILDKWYPEFKNHEGMRRLLDGLKRLVKYVVVTTGRGTPENIPEEAHLLPFAVVESTLFKKYPEKLILTDTIMNVLPVGQKNATGGQT